MRGLQAASHAIKTRLRFSKPYMHAQLSLTNIYKIPSLSIAFLDSWAQTLNDRLSLIGLWDFRLPQARFLELGSNFEKAFSNLYSKKLETKLPIITIPTCIFKEPKPNYFYPAQRKYWCFSKSITVPLELNSFHWQNSLDYIGNFHTQTFKSQVGCFNLSEDFPHML